MFGDAWILLFSLILIVGLATGGGVLAALGGMGLLLVGLAWVWSRLALERVAFQRKLSSQRAFPDETVLLTLTLTNRKALPLTWIRVQERIPREVDVVGQALITVGSATFKEQEVTLSHTTSLAPWERVRWHYQLRCGQRGFYRIGPSRLQSGDLFGFFPQLHEEEAQEFLLVYPRVIRLPELGLLPRRPLGERGGRERLYKDPARPAGVRDYVPGDPMKYLDWKATARRNALQVKLFEPGLTYSLAIFANIDTVGVPWGGYIPHHLERVASVAASLSQQTLEEGYSVGMYTNGRSVLYEHPMTVPLGRHPQQLIHIFETLAMMGPYVASPMEELLVRQARRFPAGATFVLITALMTQEMNRALELLARGGRLPAVLWVADQDPPPLAERIALVNLTPYLKTLGGFE